MNLDKIKVLKIDITGWLIDAIYNSEQHPVKNKPRDISKNVWKLNEALDIVEFELTHEDFDFYIDFDLYAGRDIDCEFKNYSHVSNLYSESDMIDFDDNRLKEIYKAVLSHF